MPVPRFLNFVDVSAGSHLLKVVFCKIEKAVGRTGPQDSRTRRTQAKHVIGFARPKVIHRWTLASQINLRVWKPVSAELGSNPEFAVKSSRQRMNDDFLRRIRVHLDKAVSIEARHASLRPYDQEAVSRLQNVVDNIYREAVFRRERVTAVVAPALPLGESYEIQPFAPTFNERTPARPPAAQPALAPAMWWQQGSTAAATTLLKVMVDPATPPSTRVRAAEAVLSQAAKAIEIEDIDARVRALEDATEGNQDGRRT
jgi:hypothetical protein